MKRNPQKQSILINSETNFVIPVHDEVQFKDIAKYLDVQMQDNIKQKLDEINQEVENLGKVCDNLYKKSSEEYKTRLNKEREDLDRNVKKYIFDLKDNLVGLKKKLNYDYKGKFLEINEKLNDISNKINNGTKRCIQIKHKIDSLNEDSSFLEKQMRDIKDLNIYLKYKLKLFLGELKEEAKEDNNIKNKTEIKESKSQEVNSKDIPDNKNKTTVNNKNENEKLSINDSNIKDKNVYEDKLYLTATKNFNNSKSNKKYIKNNEFDEVEYLNSKLNLEEAQLTNYIQHEKDKNIKLIQIYKNLYMKNQNPNFAHLKELIDEHNTINKSKSSEVNNVNESSFNNKSIMPSIYSTSLSNSASLGEKKFYTPENPGYGYINRKENKEIMLKFLESLEAKKIIYKLLYGD